MAQDRNLQAMVNDVNAASEELKVVGQDLEYRTRVDLERHANAKARQRLQPGRCTHGSPSNRLACTGCAAGENDVSKLCADLLTILYERQDNHEEEHKKCEQHILELQRQLLAVKANYSALSEASDDADGRIRTALRIRSASCAPSFGFDLTTIGDYVAPCGLANTVRLSDPSDATRYPFDYVFGPEATNSGIHESIGHLAGDVMRGYNCLVMAYGDSGSGKTFTMIRQPDSLISLFMAQVFSQIVEQQDSAKNRHVVGLAAFDIYQNKLHDALRIDETIHTQREKGHNYPSPRVHPVSSCCDATLPVPSHHTVYVEGAGIALTEQRICCTKSGIDVLQRTAARVGGLFTDATSNNAESSRAHHFVYISVYDQHADSNKQGDNQIGRILLVDLAGQENINDVGDGAKRIYPPSTISNNAATTAGAAKLSSASLKTPSPRIRPPSARRSTSSPLTKADANSAQRRNKAREEETRKGGKIRFGTPEEESKAIGSDLLELRKVLRALREGVRPSWRTCKVRELNLIVEAATARR